MVWDHPWEYDIAGPIGGSNSAGEPYESPPQAGITITPGAVITITNASGEGSWDRGTPPFSSAAGVDSDIEDDAASNGVGEHGISDVTMPLESVVGVFLGSSLPDNTTALTPLNFTTQSERDYTSIEPKLQQTFYAAAGQTERRCPAEHRGSPGRNPPVSGNDGWLGVEQQHRWIQRHRHHHTGANGSVEFLGERSTFNAQRSGPHSSEPAPF